jgi:hypothetical protein
MICLFPHFPQMQLVEGVDEEMMEVEDASGNLVVVASLA